MKLPDTVRSIVLLVVTALIVMVGWPKYMTYVLQEEMRRADIQIRRDMDRAALINEALKDKPVYLEWLRARSGR